MNKYIGIQNLYRELKEIEKNLPQLQKEEGFEAILDMTAQLISYDPKLMKLTRITDYFLFVYDNKLSNAKKDLRKLCKDFNITQFDLSLGYLLAQNFITILKDGTEEEAMLYEETALQATLGLTLGRLLMYTSCLVFGTKIGGTKENAKFLDSPVYRHEFPADIRNLYNTYIYSISGKNYDRLTDKIIKNNNIMLTEKMSLDVYAQYIVCRQLVSEMMGEMSSFYLGKLNVYASALTKVIDDSIEGEGFCTFSSSFMDLLRDRDFLIPSNGLHVTSDFTRQFLDVKDFKVEKLNGGLSMDIYERQFNGDNYLIVFDTTREVYDITILNLTKRYTFTTGSCLFEIGNRLLYLFGLSDKVDMENFPIYMNLSDEFLDKGLIIIRGTNDILSEYSIEVPYYWRYRGKTSTPCEKVNKGERLDFTHSVYIGAYKRRLPSGSNASAEAKAMSKLYCINLTEDETLVRPQVREYK